MNPEPDPDRLARVRARRALIDRLFRQAADGLSAVFNERGLADADLVGMLTNLRGMADEYIAILSLPATPAGPEKEAEGDDH